jgi:hypothetical protein
LNKRIMTISSLLLALAGAACLFMPAELGAAFGTAASAIQVALLQVTGAMYLGFAMANWMARTLPIGGIYGRPVSMANFAHFFIGAMALLKYAMSNGFNWATASILAVYMLFSVLFGYVVFFGSSGAKP